jgi:hypothetical protein
MPRSYMDGIDQPINDLIDRSIFWGWGTRVDAALSLGFLSLSSSLSLPLPLFLISAAVTVSLSLSLSLSPSPCRSVTHPSRSGPQPNPIICLRHGACAVSTVTPNSSQPVHQTRLQPGSTEQGSTAAGWSQFSLGSPVTLPRASTAKSLYGPRSLGSLDSATLFFSLFPFFFFYLPSRLGS